MSENQSFVDKYRPESLSEIAGHSKKIEKILKWADGWESGDPPLLLYGPAGTGKTTTAESLAREKGWSISEINASSTRTTDDIRSISQDIRMSTVSGDHCLFLLDEVDSYSRNVSLTPLLKVIDESPQPIVMTANEKWKVPDSLENRAKSMKFSLKKDDMKPVLQRIAQSEDINISPRQIGKLATRTGLRDAINDLQEFAESDGDVDWDRRDQDIGNFNAIDNILRGKKYTGDMTPPDVVDWLDENVSSEFDGTEGMRAYQALSEADRWLAMTNETQNYSWWRYAGTIAEEVAEMRLTEPYDWISKSYPLSRRQSTPDPKSDSPKAVLYRELKELDIPGYRASFNFTEFRNVILPILRDLEEEERMFICLSESLPKKCVKLLDISPSEYQEWRVTESGNDPEETTLGSFSDDGGDSSSEKDSLFDF